MSVTSSEAWPPPIAVPDNRWDELPSEWSPSRPMSVVIPYYEAPEALALTLAALGEQTYPADLFEVVIVDDGSRHPLPDPAAPSHLRVSVVHQDDRGFGLARARNTGAAKADGEVVVFLDCDMVPEPGWLSAHAKWHHLSADVVTLGFRSHVEFDGITTDDVRSAAAGGSVGSLFDGRHVQRPEWIEFHMARTTDLTGGQDDIFRVVTGGNLGVDATLFHDIGRFDESFTQWGAEDTEFGYRAYVGGGLLVPVREAMCWHQGLGTSPDEGETVSLDQQRAKIAHLIPHHGFRRSLPGRSFLVPHTVVSVLVEPTDPAERVTETVERVLGNRFHDLVVALDVPVAHPHAAWLTRQFEHDPRVVVGDGVDPFERFPRSARHVTIPAQAHVRDYAIDHLHAELGSAGRLDVDLGDGSAVEMTAGRAAHRERRSGQPIEDAFGVTQADWRDVGIQPRSASAGRGGARGAIGGIRRSLQSPDSRAGKVWRQVKAIDSPGDAVRVGKWLAGAVRQQVASGSRHPAAPTLAPGPGGTSVARSVAPLGAAVATHGADARAVLAASARAVHIDNSLDDMPDSVLGHLDVLVTSGADADLAQAAAGRGAGIVDLTDVADERVTVPAVDLVQTNPVGWIQPASADRVVASPTGAAGAPGLRVLDPGQPGFDIEVKAAHHIVDRAEMHASPARRAARIVTMAALGGVVIADDVDAEIRALLGGELADIISGSAPSTLHAREELSVAGRRAALRNHSLVVRVAQLVALAGRVPDPAPAVSVVLPSNRPDRVQGALAQIDRQTYAELEVVVAAHGDGFDEAQLRAAAGTTDVTIVRAPERWTLGQVLRTATSAASGSLITKWDDDDFYGPEHVWDLVLAHAYSGAQLVGKAAEFVYLAETDQTIRRFVGGAETYTTTIGGGAMLISAHDLEAAGGWRRVPRQVDRALVEDVALAGGRTYRTHGFGYVLNRHGTGHTWDEGDAYFLTQAEDRRPGLARPWAGIDDG